MQPIRLATRKSPLALAQAHSVRDMLLLRNPEAQVDICPMDTTGDQRTDRTLADIGGKGLFTKELEEALLAGRVDIAVHSLKDMETSLRDEFMISAVLPRADARDALVMQGQGSLAALPQGARVGTSSLRRAAMLHILRPDIEVVPFRGNVNTRLAKLERGEADATILAVAGLERLGLEQVITERLDKQVFIPAVAQGIIAVESRKRDERINAMLAVINHAPSWVAATAERSLLKRLDGSCRTPIAAHAEVSGDRVAMAALVAKPDGSQHVRAEANGTAADAERLGIELAEMLLKKGGAACLV